MVTLESALSRPASQKLRSEQSDQELLQVLVQNSSQESRTLRTQLWTLHTQVLLLTSSSSGQLDANTLAG